MRIVQFCYRGLQLQPTHLLDSRALDVVGKQFMVSPFLSSLQILIRLPPLCVWNCHLFSFADNGSAELPRPKWFPLPWLCLLSSDRLGGIFRQPCARKQIEALVLNKCIFISALDCSAFSDLKVLQLQMCDGFNLAALSELSRLKSLEELHLAHTQVCPGLPS
jgi:hypothetical protein